MGDDQEEKNSMTTIAGCPRRGLLCCDSNVADGSQKWSEPKIERIGDTLYGACGDAVDCDKFFSWIRAGAKGRKPKLDEIEFNALALNAKGLFWFDNKLHPIRHKTAFAIGSGALAVRAALLCDATLERAMEIACEIADGNALPVQIYSITEGEKQ
jgi:hypothetical protein